MNEEEIVKKLDGDSEIVEIWIRFLCEMGWLVKDSSSNNNDNNRWMLTDMGKIELVRQQVIGDA